MRSMWREECGVGWIREGGERNGAADENRVIWEITELPGKPQPQGITTTMTTTHTFLTPGEETQGDKWEQSRAGRSNTYLYWEQMLLYQGRRLTRPNWNTVMAQDWRQIIIAEGPAPGGGEVRPGHVPVLHHTWSLINELLATYWLFGFVHLQKK